MTSPVTTTPQLSMDLRLRFLETLLSSPTRPPSGHLLSSTTSDSLPRRIAYINTQLHQAIDTSGSGADAVRRFVATYEVNEPLLTCQPPAPQSSLTGADLTPGAKVTLILEAEQEIRALERDLRDIETLAERDVVGAGRLAEHESLKPGLEILHRRLPPVSTDYIALETRVTNLLGRYNDYISTLSELFVEWNDIVSDAEATVSKLEKRRAQAFDIS